MKPYNYNDKDYSFAELLTLNEWKTRRAAILIRDNNKCRSCYSRENLDVYPIQYISWLMPWQYGDGDLLTLCSECLDKLINFLHFDLNFRFRLLKDPDFNDIALMDLNRLQINMIMTYINGEKA